MEIHQKQKKQKLNSSFRNDLIAANLSTISHSGVDNLTSINILSHDNESILVTSFTSSLEAEFMRLLMNELSIFGAQRLVKEEVIIARRIGKVDENLSNIVD